MRPRRLHTFHGLRPLRLRRRLLLGRLLAPLRLRLALRCRSLRPLAPCRLLPVGWRLTWAVGGCGRRSISRTLPYVRWRLTRLTVCRGRWESARALRDRWRRGILLPVLLPGVGIRRRRSRSGNRHRPGSIRHGGRGGLRLIRPVIGRRRHSCVRPLHDTRQGRVLLPVPRAGVCIGRWRSRSGDGSGPRTVRLSGVSGLRRCGPIARRRRRNYVRPLGYIGRRLGIRRRGHAEVLIRLTRALRSGAHCRLNALHVRHVHDVNRRDWGRRTLPHLLYHGWRDRAAWILS